MEALKYRSAELRALGADVDETRTVEFVISNEKRDRHGTVLRAKGWQLDNYKRNPVVGYQHTIHGSMFSEPNPDSVIGRSEVFFEGDNLIGRVTFEPPEINPLAEKIFQKVKFGSLRSASVGFMPTGEPTYGTGKEARGKENETMYFPGQELMEWSIVHIPSLASANKREYSDEMDEFLLNASQAMEGKLKPEELRKMTIEGIVRMVTGESLEKDKTEREESDEQQVAEDLMELDPEFIRQQKQMEVDLAIEDNELDVKRIERKFEKEHKRLLEGFDRDFSIITPEDQIRMMEEDFDLNKEEEHE
jgi:hypothetical protein